MTTPAIQTVTGPIAPDELGPTLMHEHLTVGYPGFESHTTRPGAGQEERVAICVDRIGDRLIAHGLGPPVTRLVR